MGSTQSSEVIGTLRKAFDAIGLSRPGRVDRYEPGTILSYDATGVFPSWQARVKLQVERFVGGGFAGQVYQIKILEIDSADDVTGDLVAGNLYAMKILLPPSKGSQYFRNAIYAIGFQSAFTIQVNPSAARTGALWQKFIRAAAGMKFGTQSAITDIHCTFVDTTIGACGEISEWIEGRTWRYEVDDQLDTRGKRDSDGKLLPNSSKEYLAKKTFMADLVEMLKDMGAVELARQYEWWTCKSQPNCLKRSGFEDDPAGGLTAVDFRAGLALLPILPMSPADFWLIAKGVTRGSLVQFDRGNLVKLQDFVDANPDVFEGMADALDELKTGELAYRNSMIDVTHNHLKLLYSGKLWSGILDAAAVSEGVRGIADAKATQSLRASKFKTIIFVILGLGGKLSMLAGLGALIASGGLWAFGALNAADPNPWPLPIWATITAIFMLIAIPKITSFIRAIWGRADYRKHYRRIITSPKYLIKALHGRLIETLISWVRSGRMHPSRAEQLSDKPAKFISHAILAVLPILIHRSLTDWQYVKGILFYIFVRPVRLFTNAQARHAWLIEMIEEGKRKNMLTDRDADEILSRIDDPFIQKYLKSLAVHVCTLPITQVVSFICAAVYITINWGSDSFWNLFATGAGIIAIFQVMPISPGSLVRGLYVLYLVIKERNFKDYNIAVFLGFFKYVGYLAFPIQMAYHYPALARFMAAHWATGAVHVVPVFGEHGALMEHSIFDLFYNYPLTVRKRIIAKTALREGKRRRFLPAIIAIIAAAAGFVSISAIAISRSDVATSELARSLSRMWPAVILIPFFVGWVASAMAGGMRSSRRIVFGALAGVLLGLAYSAGNTALIIQQCLWDNSWISYYDTALAGVWSMFLFAIFALIGAVIAETRPSKKTAVREPPI